MQRLILAFMFILMVVVLPSLEVDSPPLGSFWMDPIKLWTPDEKFTIWFRPEIKESQILHFCLSTRAKWSKIGSGGFHLTIGGWIHYWTISKDELTFEGRLPSKTGEVSLVKVGKDKLKCGSQAVTIQIQQIQQED